MIKIGDLNVKVDYHYNQKQQRVVKAMIFDNEEKYVAEGKATCSKADNFCKDTGRKKAFAAAFGSRNAQERITKKQRTSFWKSYQQDMTKTPRW